MTLKLKKRIQDAAAELLGFPWSVPAEPASRSTTSSGFLETDSITDEELLDMFLRNPMANAIVMDVAYDAISTFEVISLEETKLKEFDAEVHKLYKTNLGTTLKKALLFTRLYGYCGILIGYSDGKPLEEEAKRSAKIKYTQVIPKTWISDVVLKKDRDGNTTIPLELDYYEVRIGGAKKKIDASRIVHIANRSIKEEALTGESSLLRIFDALTVIRSMVWGVGQAMWRAGGGLTVFIAPEDSVDEQAQIDAITEVTADINSMTVLAMPAGTKVETGEVGALNPKEYFDVITKQVSIGSRVPTSILTGSQAGTLTASEKDRIDYAQLLASIQDSLATPALEDMLRRFQDTGQLSKQEFSIKWDRPPIWRTEEMKGDLLRAQADLTKAQTDTEKAEAAKKKLEAKDMREQMSLWEVL